MTARDNGVSQADRRVGGLLGVIVGDAIGVPWEFQPAHTAPRPTPAIGFGAHHQPPGTWSDDGSMTLALLESMLEVGWDLEDQARRFLAWYEDAQYTSGGVCFDTGITITHAFRRLRDGVPAAEAGPADDRAQSNGSLMRILPVALLGDGRSDAELVARAEEATRVTHGHPRVAVASAIYTLVARELLAGADPVPALERAQERLRAVYAADPARERLIGSCLELKVALGGAYVADSLVSALLALQEGADFRDVVETAISYGGDTDTTGAIAGGLAGIRFGARAIPGAWLDPVRSQPGWFIVEGLAARLR